jgi:hypothetical protein
VTRERRWRGLGGAAAVALLHAALVWALLIYSHSPSDKPRVAAGHEIFFYFPPHRPPHRNERPADRATTAPAIPATPALLDYRGITLPESQTAPSLSLNRSLFGCSPQEMANLSREERARCANAIPPDDSVDFRDGTSRSQSAALWERGRERKNAPLLLPCMSPNAPLSLGTVICLARGAVKGLDLNSQPSYADTPEQFHLPNNGDPPDKPTYGP